MESFCNTKYDYVRICRILFKFSLAYFFRNESQNVKNVFHYEILTHYGIILQETAVSSHAYAEQSDNMELFALRIVLRRQVATQLEPLHCTSLTLPPPPMSVRFSINQGK